MKYLEQIDDFIEGRLHGDPLEKFELQMQEDAEFKKVVDDYLLIQKAADGLLEFELSDEIHAGISDVKEVKQFNEPIDPKTNTKLSRNGLIILFIIVSLVVIWFVNRPKSIEPKTPTTIEKTDQEQRQNPIDEESIENPTHIKDGSKPPGSKNGQNLNQRSIASNEQTGKEIYVKNFRPYRHPSLAPNLRGVAILAPREQFEAAYWDKKYQVVTNTWESLAQVEKINPKLKFLYANALLAMDKTETAIGILESSSKQTHKQYDELKSWYLAMAYLRNGRLDKAIQLLYLIQNNSAHPYHSKANSVIEQIQLDK